MAKDLGISPAAMHTRLYKARAVRDLMADKAAQRRTHARPVTTKMAQEMACLYRAGTPVAQIAREFNLAQPDHLPPPPQARRHPANAHRPGRSWARARARRWCRGGTPRSPTCAAGWRQLEALFREVLSMGVEKVVRALAP